MSYMFPHSLRVMSILRCVEGCNDMKEYILRCHATYLCLAARASLSMLGLGCCGLRKNTLQCHEKLPTLSIDGHPSLCVLRGCGDFVADLYLAIISPPFGRSILLYIDGDVHDFKPYICHPSALLTGGIPMYFQSYRQQRYKESVIYARKLKKKGATLLGIAPSLSLNHQPIKLS